jgi:hypothetical protein
MSDQLGDVACAVCELRKHTDKLQDRELRSAIEKEQIELASGWGESRCLARTKLPRSGTVKQAGSLYGTLLGPMV